MNNRSMRWLAYVALSIVISPLIVFNAGLLLVGEYLGEGGIMGFLGGVYGDALRFSLSAWIILLGPVLLVLIWLGVRRIWQSIPADKPSTDSA
jgi:hypothetical protein